MQISDNNYIAEAFREYRTMGLDPLPIPYIDGHPAKHPTEVDWQVKAANGEYNETDFKGPFRNLGNLLGGPKNLTDIDLDWPEGLKLATEIMEEFARGYAPTMMFGRESKPKSHYIYYCDQSLPSEKVNDPTDDTCIVEYRCACADGHRGCQTVFPPSKNFDTLTSKVEDVRLESDSAEIATVPAANLHKAFVTIAATSLLAKHFPEKGDRHNTILALAGVFARSGMAEKKAAALVGLAYRHSKGYNRDHKKADADVHSVYKSHDKESDKHLFGYPMLIETIPKAVVDKVLDLLGIAKPKADYPFSDAGNGHRLVDKHKDEARYCVDDKEWYVWDGVRWRRDLVQRIRELAKAIAMDVRHEANGLKEPIPTGDQREDSKAIADWEDHQSQLFKWATQSENADRVSKTILSAESDPRVTCFRADFDKDANLLNCVNGIVDLYTGTLLPHDRTVMMSNLCPVEYDPTATHPIFVQSLAAFTRNHEDLLPFLKTLAGYTAQGDKSEERIFVLQGPGYAGKGTFIDWFTNALGPDYACAMDAVSVLKQKRDSAAASGDIARLQGKRLVVVSEIEKGNRLQESFLKQASGNHSLVARGLYKSEREFRPTHQFWFQTNYRPGFDSTDSGNKRRYIEIPFDNDLSKDPNVVFDSKLKIRMRQDKTFLKAVLAWVVDGCIEWRQHGLQIPESVNIATAALFAHNDFLNLFITERCIKDPKGRVFVNEFRREYEDWCREEDEEPSQGRTFNNMMRERGFERRQATIDDENRKAWYGIKLIDPNRKRYISMVREYESETARAVQPTPRKKPISIADRIGESELPLDMESEDATAVG
jgi:P4 family phage/plasmid primase-like protien